MCRTANPLFDRQSHRLRFCRKDFRGVRAGLNRTGNGVRAHAEDADILRPQFAGERFDKGFATRTTDDMAQVAGMAIVAAGATTVIMAPGERRPYGG